ncbi:DUF6884 domain-containing protein [Asanoa iriomotensis]|uniref:Uncharacterized protein n=1 Tax=Asanoa iriomotensis TaxID=234613 RepID=A0ABQ4CAW0_9ACTN|nr:DUF6884 domain-containing protein [Asanoa iriomotensis]GIF59898.1 hypothetical protein Air01nite_59930 [Asanoa iriomotensis]
MAQWEALREVLDKGPTTVRLTWSELELIVGRLPRSAGKHRAWWSGDRRHVHVWRSAGYTASDIVLGEAITFIRTGEPVSTGRIPRERKTETTGIAAKPRRRAGAADLLLVGCVKAKLDVPAAARDLYISPLFRMERAYAERRGVPWFILSAEHALVAPDEWLAPYERYLPDTPARYRGAWGQWVAERLDLLAGPLAGCVVEVHAGAAYVDAIAKPLSAKGASLVDTLQGLSLGERLAWYDTEDAHLDVDSADASNVVVSDVDVAAFADQLRLEATAISPREFLARLGAGLGLPGLYSWWVDSAGAADLSRGLDHPVGAGLIYAGLAGATRWPSGKRSANTLWARIAGMHLGGTHEFSTFRRTLGSVLANADLRDRIDENALTIWMHDHLRVVAVPCVDADTLGRLEEAVLRSLDPPLNLKWMARTPVRAQLIGLRRKYGQHLGQ